MLRDWRANGTTSILAIVYTIEYSVYNITVEDAIKIFKAPLVKILFEAVATCLVARQGTCMKTFTQYTNRCHSVWFKKNKKLAIIHVIVFWSTSKTHIYYIGCGIFIKLMTVVLIVSLWKDKLSEHRCEQITAAGNECPPSCVFCLPL